VNTGHCDWELQPVIITEFIDVYPHDTCDYYQSVLENSDQLFNFSQPLFSLRLLKINIDNSHCKDLPMFIFLHRTVCLFTSQLLVVLILPTQMGWPGGVNPVADQIPRRCERNLYLCIWLRSCLRLCFYIFRWIYSRFVCFCIFIFVNPASGCESVS